MDFSTGKANNAAIARHNPHEDAEESGLAGTVAAAKRMNRAGTEIDGPLAEGGNTRKRLGHTSGSQKKIIRARLVFGRGRLLGHHTLRGGELRSTPTNVRI